MPQGTIATIPKFQFSANNGVPMVGGTLDTYIAGSTTPATTWQDSALTIANTNPISLDARGECVLWLDPAVVYKFVLKNAPANGGVVQWTQDNISGAQRGSFATDLAAANGASLVGYLPPATGAVATTVAKQIDSRMRHIVDFGGSPTATAAQNDTAFALAASWLQQQSAIFGSGNLQFAAGNYDYNTSPNWAGPRIFLHCEPGTVFSHKGTGPAVVFDGGATGGGVFVSGLVGNPLIKGNLNTTDGLYVRAVHRGAFEARIRDVGANVANIIWNVCTEFNLRCSPLGEPAFSITPSAGIRIAARGVGETTSACTFINPVMEGIKGYGILIAGGVMNTFVGGTSESNTGGIFIEADLFGNTFLNMDCEFNTGNDLFCRGSQNTFINLYADKLVEFTATSSFNRMVGGRVNTLTDTTGSNGNEFDSVMFGIAGGAFTPQASTIHRGMRNAASPSTYLPSYDLRVRSINTFGSSDAERLLVGQSDRVSGGVGAVAADVDLFKAGTGNTHLRAAGGMTAMSFGSAGLGFHGKAPVGIANVTGSRGGNAALANLLTILDAKGVILNGTTA